MCARGLACRGLVERVTSMRTVGLTDSDVGECSVLGGKVKQDTDGGDVISFFSSFPSWHWLGSILTSSGDGAACRG